MARILVVNSEALSTLVWAEDGLFPLCVLKENVWTCLSDPFAGYLLAGPRLIAGVVSLFPMTDWAMATNLSAALIAGLCSGIAFAVLRNAGVTLAGSALGSLVVVLAPIVGLEAINAVGSVYMPLVFVSAVAIAFPPRSRAGLVGVGVLLAVTSTTIPSAIVLVAAVVIVWVRGKLRPTPAMAFTGILALGLVVQWFVSQAADNPRNIAITGQGLVDWITATPLAIVSYWPGLYFGEATTFGIFVVPPFWATGAILLAAILGWGVWSAVRGNAGVGALLLVGVGVGAIPTLTGYASNRYFVLPALLWFVAVVVSLDRQWRSRRWAMPAVLVGCLVVWSPAFGASAWRAGATPLWTDEVARIAAACSADPAASVDVRFSPDWPMDITALEEPTVATALCVEIADRL